jgi:hypothetical protein
VVADAVEVEVEVEVVIDGDGVESPGTLTVPSSASVAEVVERVPDIRSWTRTLYFDGQKYVGHEKIGTIGKVAGPL